MKEFGGFEAARRREHNVLAGIEAPRNEGEHQYVLAEELFTRDFPSETMRIDDTGFKNRVMEYWIENKSEGEGHSYARAFRDLVEHPDFKKHYRFHGNSLNVTLSDVESFLHNSELPER